MLFGRWDSIPSEPGIRRAQAKASRAIDPTSAQKT